MIRLYAATLRVYTCFPKASCRPNQAAAFPGIAHDLLSDLKPEQSAPGRRIIRNPVDSSVFGKKTRKNRKNLWKVGFSH